MKQLLSTLRTRSHDRKKHRSFFFFITLKPRVKWYTKSMSLKYEPASEPLHISVKHRSVSSHVHDKDIFESTRSRKDILWVGASLKRRSLASCVHETTQFQVVHFFFFFFFFITLKPRIEWYKSLWALNTSPPRNRWNHAVWCGTSGKKRVWVCMGVPRSSKTATP